MHHAYRKTRPPPHPYINHFTGSANSSISVHFSKSSFWLVNGACPPHHYLDNCGLGHLNVAVVDTCVTLSTDPYGLHCLRHTDITPSHSFIQFRDSYIRSLRSPVSPSAHKGQKSTKLCGGWAWRLPISTSVAGPFTRQQFTDFYDAS